MSLPHLISNARIRLGAFRNMFVSLMASFLTRGIVKQGPFAGVRLLATIYHGSSGGSLAPKLVGTYECELHSAVSDIVSAAPQRLVIVGGGDGYYACGMAALLPIARITAFEADPATRRSCALNLEANKLEQRVELLGKATLELLQDALNERRSCVIMDCEGTELELLNPERLPMLSSAVILVEVHDFIDSSIGSALEGRFAPTHHIRHLPQESRPVPLTWLSKPLTVLTRMLQNEHRILKGNYWLFLDPK